jgi:hypothetical protein
MPLLDDCTSEGIHFSLLTCSSKHHCGPVFLEGYRLLCGECGRVMGIVPQAARPTRNGPRNRFIPVHMTNQTT